MTQVLIVQALAKRYRVPFFDGLHAALASAGMQLTVAYSHPPQAERLKADDVSLDPVYGVRVPGVWLLHDRLLYQQVLPLARSARLVVVEQASKQLVNLLLLLRARLTGTKVAFWGTGRNVLGDGSPLAEWMKAQTIALPDWWFAYTSGVADYVTSHGVRPENVTVVQNAIDTRRFRAELAAVTDEEIARARTALNMTRTSHVGVFCGSLYRGKKIEFLIEAARRIRAELPDFQLVIIGAGPAQPDLAASACGANWLHFVGRQTGAGKAIYFRMADVFLIPAFVGLAIVDAFAAGLPVVTTHLPRGHGVEIEYVQHEVNGLVTDHDSVTYAMAVTRLLRQPELHGRLSAGARTAGDRYTIEAMVDNFAGGILRCLRQPTDSAAPPRG